jgi:hypothetical protein
VIELVEKGDLQGGSVGDRMPRWTMRYLVAGLEEVSAWSFGYVTDDGFDADDGVKVGASRDRFPDLPIVGSSIVFESDVTRN